MLFLNDTTTPRTTESNISDTFPTENSVHEDNLFERNVDYEIPDTRDTVDADPEYNITLNNNSCVPSSPKSVKSILNSGQDVSDTEIVVDSPAKVANPTKKMKKTYGNSFEDQLLELEREKNNKISALLKNQLDNSENDEDMYFFKSLLPHFKKMNSIQKLRMRNQFQAIIINELQSTQTNQRPLLTTASVPYHYDTAGTSYSYPSSSSSAASYYPSHNPEFVEYTNNLQPNIGIQSCQNNSVTMFKNAMLLISTGLRSVQGPSHACGSMLINSDTFSRMGKSVRQLSIQNTADDHCKPLVVSTKKSYTSSPPFAINGFGRIGKTVTVYTEKDPEKIKWKESQVEYVIDSTGKFTEVEAAKKHIAAGAKKVIISAPSKDAPMFVKGVNFDKYKKDMTVVSNASCTTNCAAPLMHIINQQFGVEHCLLTTVHAVTSSQHVLDGVHHRSGVGNIAHSTTGAAKAVGIVIPELKGKVTGDPIRVPVLVRLALQAGHAQAERPPTYGLDGIRDAAVGRRFPVPGTPSENGRPAGPRGFSSPVHGFGSGRGGREGGQQEQSPWPGRTHRQDTPGGAQGAPEHTAGPVQQLPPQWDLPCRMEDLQGGASEEREQAGWCALFLQASLPVERCRQNPRVPARAKTRGPHAYLLEGVNGGNFCLAVSIDVRNALNTVKWSDILDALPRWRVPQYLLNMFRSYFSGRTGTVHANCAEGGTLEIEISGGVPQGSVVGPLLWNATFDAVMRTELPSGAKLLGFADDTMLVTRAKSTQELEAVTNEALSLVEQRITGLGLQIAVEKTEAVLFTYKYKYTQPAIKLCGGDVELSTEMNYLGMVVDRSMLFKGQVKKAAARAAGIGNQLARIMPNVGGPREDRRRLLSSVVHSVLLYGAPSWAHTLELVPGNVQTLNRAQRKVLLRCICAYRTVSKAATNVIASTPPADLLAVERMAAFDRRRAPAAPTAGDVPRTKTMVAWQERWSTEESGSWTRRPIPDVRPWCARSHGLVTNFHLTQFLSGHGCFGQYLHRFRKSDNPRCVDCRAPTDDAEHAFFECDRWWRRRMELKATINGPFTPETVVGKMMESRSNWTAVERFVKEVLTKREAEERERQHQEQNT
ncbi:hypothetical protein QTP88_027063 [Uroleucon formosanum]